MREIIEPGKKSFVLTCNHCGCKFRYELEDIGCGDDVYCPDCHSRCFHPRQEETNHFEYYPLDYTNTPWVFDYKDTTGTPILNPGLNISCEGKNEGQN